MSDKYYTVFGKTTCVAAKCTPFGQQIGSSHKKMGKLLEDEFLSFHGSHLLPALRTVSSKR